MATTFIMGDVVHGLYWAIQLKSSGGHGYLKHAAKRAG